MKPYEKFIISEFGYHKHTVANVKQPFKRSKKKIIKLKPSKCRSFIVNFYQYLQDSTLHGLKYIGNTKISLLERYDFITVAILTIL